MPIRIVRRQMFNAPERVEWYMALEDFPLMPVPQPRLDNRDALIAYLERLLDEAKFGDVMEVME